MAFQTKNPEKYVDLTRECLNNVTIMSTAKVILLIGKICSGKSYYASKLKAENQNTVNLSVDEITLAFKNSGLEHEILSQASKEYLYKKSLELINDGINVILDWGFWKKVERDYARNFFLQNNILYEFHYIKVDNNEWEKRIEKRNNEVQSGKNNDAYFLDEGLKNKLLANFEEPDPDEIDVLV